MNIHLFYNKHECHLWVSIQNLSDRLQDASASQWTIFGFINKATECRCLSNSSSRTLESRKMSCLNTGYAIPIRIYHRRTHTTLASNHNKPARRHAGRRHENTPQANFITQRAIFHRRIYCRTLRICPPQITICSCHSSISPI